MIKLFSNLLFRHTFRGYQTRVLNQLDHHLIDKKVHIVAPPGAGKTILGLEIIKRIGESCLVLVPTLVIRSQWVERLKDDFEHGQQFAKEYISHDLQNPTTLTIITYQGLHQALKQDKELISTLSFFSTIVVDECHHLRREWWRSINEIVKRHRPIIIALTATPPYDANGLEWRRYHEFCGPIDEEISTPELVASGDLCPHQDFVWPVLPNLGEQETLNTFIEQRKEFWSFLKHYRILGTHIQEHPWFCKIEDHFESLYDRPEYFTAMLSTLKFLGYSPPVAALGVLHGEATIPPDLNNDWLSCFLEHSLYDDPYWASIQGKEVLRPIKNRLSRMDALERKKVHLEIPYNLAKRLRKSSNKLSSVKDIISIEHENLENELRLVVLCDFINAEVLPTTEYDQPELKKLGAAPIFEYLRRTEIYFPPTTLLTGSLVIIPKSCQSFLEKFAQEENTKISFRLITGLADHIQVQFNTSVRKKLVRWITRLFTEGDIQIIIGTQALLGEGWDAPAINSLVLANTVGSYVLSNQMRGRAIRTFKERPEKTANIWHLVTIDSATQDGGYDLNLLKRRFKAFVGPNHYGTPYLSNDMNRMGSFPVIQSKEQLDKLQQQVKLIARARTSLNDRWKEALTNGNQLVTIIQLPVFYEKREDGLSKYYHIQATNSVEDVANKLSKALYSSLFIAIIASALAFLELGAKHFFVWLLTIGIPLIFLASIKGVKLFKAIYDLKQLKKFFKKAYLAIIISGGLFLITTLLDPIIGFSFSLISILSFSLYFLVSQLTTLSTFNFYKKIGQLDRFSFSIGKSILAAMVNENLATADTQHQLKSKKSNSAFPLLYLNDASRYESEIFEKSISEFFNPVERQRYLLLVQAQGASSQDVHYIAVPSVFKYKAAAEYFCAQIKRHFDQDVKLIYTRTPSGRLHLLNARLQVLDLNEDCQTRREKIWL